MKITKRLFVIIGFITATALPTITVFAQKDAKSASAEVLVEVKAIRDGDKVTLTWTLPKGDDWRMVTISRNDRVSPKGRAKVKGINPAKHNSYVDTVPEANKQYWYWLKATRTGKDSVEVGPIEVRKL